MPITGFFICRSCRRLENSGADVCWMKSMALRLKINCDPQCVLWAHWVLDSPVKIHCSLHTPQLRIESGHSAQSISTIISRYCFFQIAILGYLVPTAFIRLNSSVHKSCHSAKSSTSLRNYLWENLCPSVRFPIWQRTDQVWECCRDTHDHERQHISASLTIIETC